MPKPEGSFTFETFSYPFYPSQSCRETTLYQRVHCSYWPSHYVLTVMDVASSVRTDCPENRLLGLPAEIRIAILEFVFDNNPSEDGFTDNNETGVIVLDDSYSSIDRLRPLLICRQMYEDGNQLAFERTNFVTTSLYGQVPRRLMDLRDEQVENIRHVSFVADAKQFRDLVEWGHHPFNRPALRLDTLTIVLHRSSFWHYLNDHTHGVVKLLRNLQYVKRIVIIQNKARVKGSFKTWYNRLVGLIMKVDHLERFEKSPPTLELVWWKWSYDGVAQRIILEAHPPKPTIDERSYLEMMLPLIEDWKLSTENEEWNPDPRSRNMYY